MIIHWALLSAHYVSFSQLKCIFLIGPCLGSSVLSKPMKQEFKKQIMSDFFLNIYNQTKEPK